MNHLIQKFKRISLEEKLNWLRMTAIIPMVIGVSILLMLMISFNEEYNKTAQNVTMASKFNFSFSEDMDYKMYRIVIGAETFETMRPYAEINRAREVFDRLNSSAVTEESKIRTRQIMKLLDNLEKCIKEIEAADVMDDYVENDKRLRMDVNVFTEIIKDKVSQYIYYETGNLEHLRLKLEKDIMRTIGISVVTFTILVFVIWKLTNVITKSITRPIKELCEMTQQVAEGNFNVIGPQNIFGELEILSRNFDYMVERVSTLIDDVKVEQTNLRKKELELLQAQINPHFLYNTLDTIMWLAIDNQNDKVVEMVTALSQFFRTSLSGGQDMIPIREELEHVRSYLDIQQLRYGDIMKYSIDVPKSIQDNLIIKMTLQPLVENALYHGIKMQRGKGKIAINAVEDEQNIYIVVEDNGIGMKAEEVEQFNQEMTNGMREDRKEHFGLNNVNRRIKLYFGEEYGLILESELGVGTKTIVVVPKADNLKS